MSTKKTAKSEERAAMSVTDLFPMPGSRKKRKRRGIGEGSGLGKTSGKGGKGQSMRSGGKVPRGFEGGQMPLHRRLPKRGFVSQKKVWGENDYAIVKLEKLAALAPSTVVNRDFLVEQGLVRNGRRKIKILGGAELKNKLVVEADAFSLSAKTAIEKAGGEAKVSA